MSDELVRRLREAEAIMRRMEGRPEGDGGLCDEAAKRIEALEATNRGLVRLNEAAEARAIAAESALAASEAKVARLVEALTAHHRWHLQQDRDADAWGIDPVDAYLGSGLCEMTCAALASVQAQEGEGTDG